jgi:predicted YcjX-like family ATPase
LGIGDWADGLIDGIERTGRDASAWFEPTLRLGVTGLSGAGKTVFITALVASLLSRGRMRLFSAEADGRILTAMLRPQPDRQVPRFAYEAHLADLTGPQPVWPESTRQVSQLRLSLRYRPGGFLASWAGASTLHLDIIDYPGEWLLDLPLIDQSYQTWARAALTLAETPARRDAARDWHAALAKAEASAPHGEPAAEALARAWTGYLAACRAAGLSALAPGRFLMPGDLAGSPALTFAPLPKPENAGRGSLYAEMDARYDAYKRVVVKPFFRDHFARLDRQVVLVDALDALARGPRALGDLTATMAGTLACFRHGQSSWLDRLLGGHRIDRILFAASKADHLHHEQHPRLTALIEAMLAEAANRAAFGGAQVRAVALAAIRATVEQEITRKGERLPLVRGHRLPDRKQAAVFPGELPADPAATLAYAATALPGKAPSDWADANYAAVKFAPPRWGSANGAIDGRGPPHIRLDAALEYLIGDKLE